MKYEGPFYQISTVFKTSGDLKAKIDMDASVYYFLSALKLKKYIKSLRTSLSFEDNSQAEKFIGKFKFLYTNDKYQIKVFFHLYFLEKN